MFEEYVTAKETAEKWGISQRRVQVLCVAGRIPGVKKYASVWAIPKLAEKPKDIRVKSENKIELNEGC